MKKNIKPLIDLGLLTLFTVFLLGFFIPKNIWNKVFSIINNQTATVFQGVTSGNWNDTETWGLHGGLLAISLPESIDIVSSSEIYIHDWQNGTSNRRVVILNADGTASTSYNNILVGSSGWALDMEVSETTKEIYFLTDLGIEVRNPDATASTTYSFSNGSQNRFFLANNGYFYIANQNVNKVQVKNPDGTASTTEFSSLYSGSPTSTTTPFAVTVTNDGKVCVIDFYGTLGTGRLAVYNPDGTVFGIYNGSNELWGTAVLSDINIAPNGDIYINSSLGFIVLNPDFTLDGVYNPSIDVSSSKFSIASTSKIYTYQSVGSTKQIIVLNPNGTTNTTHNGQDLPSNFVPVEGVDYPGPSDTIHINGGTVNLTANHSIKTLNLYSSGTLDLNGYTLTVASDGGIINTGGNIIVDGGRIDYLGLWTTATSGSWNASETWGGSNPTPVEGTDYPGLADSVVINTGTTTLVQNQSVKNITVESGGTLNLNGNTLNVYGDWMSSGGSLQSNTGNEGTVNFVSTSTQTISGNATFENLVKVATQNSSLLFGTDNLITVLNTLNLSGVNQGITLSISPSGFLPPQQTLSIPSGSGFSTGPLDVVTDSNGNIYSRRKSSDIQKFDSNGNLIEVFGSAYLNSSALQGSISIDSSDNLIVTDPALLQFMGQVPAIEKFSVTGTNLLSFGSYGTGDGQFSTLPGGLALDSQGNIYVSDNNNRVQKFDSNGNYISQFGSYGTGNGQFWLPWGIAIDANDNIYVVDVNNDRVQKFDSNGNYLSQFGSDGSLNGQFNNSYGGIALDAAGNIYVTDKLNHRVQIFNPDGSYKSQFGSNGSGSGQFFHPQGIHVDENNNIYVADTGNARIVKYSYTTFPNFNIFHAGSGSLNLSYLAVSGSTNTSENIFNCISCVNLGNNFNWQISRPDRRVYVETVVATTTATTTEEITATTTEPTATTTPEIEEPKEKEPKKEETKTRPRALSTTTVDVVNTTQNITPTSTIVLATTSTSTKAVLDREKPESGLQNVISNVAGSVKETLFNEKQIKTVDSIVNSEVGSAVTKTISTTGVVAGASVAISAVTFANPITLAEIWLIPARIFGLLMGALGIRRKNRPWGTVYDSVTKRPIDPAYVSLLDIETGKEIASAITDLDGRYSFSVLPGKYRIVASKTNYIPSTKMATKTFDEVYSDLYHGDVITIETEGEVITKNIPMDPQTFDWNEFTKNKMNVNTFIKERDITWAKISKIVFVVGFFVSVLGLIFSPAPYNMIIAGFYLVAYVLNYFVLKTKKAGSIVETKTNSPLSFAIVKVFREGEDTPVLKRIADKFGNYYALVPKGKYSIKIDKKNDDGSYGEVFSSGLLDITNGVVNMSVRV